MCDKHVHCQAYNLLNHEDYQITISFNENVFLIRHELYVDNKHFNNICPSPTKSYIDAEITCEYQLKTKNKELDHMLHLNSSYYNSTDNKFQYNSLMNFLHHSKEADSQGHKLGSGTSSDQQNVLLYQRRVRILSPINIVAYR